jgi:hypothetical protein
VLDIDNFDRDFRDAVSAVDDPPRKVLIMVHCLVHDLALVPSSPGEPYERRCPRAGCPTAVRLSLEQAPLEGQEPS